MRAQLSNRDYEQLSAYIDGQLAPGERRRLEERIHTQPELQVALDELNRTRTLLKQAPRRHAPRNFTLTPEMIGEANLRRKSSRGIWSSRGGWNLNLFPILSFSSALALLVLVALLIFQLLPGKPQTMTVAQAPQAQAPQAAPNIYTTENARNATGSAASSGAANKAAVEPTTGPAGTAAAADTTAAADQAAQPAGAAAESQPAGAAPAPAATQPAMLQAPAAPAAGAPAGAAAKSADSGVPPIIAWNGASPYGDQAAATGRGGGGGGDGGASLPQQGSLLGPPAANNTYGTVPSGQDVYGMGGMGGGGVTGTSPLTGPVNLPAESVNSLENNAAARTANPPAPVNNAIQGAGPILGVPGSGQGGQIIEQRSLVGSPSGAQPTQETPAGQRPASERAPNASPADAPANSGAAAPGGVSLPVLEALLGLIALITGGAAVYLWRQSRR